MFIKLANFLSIILGPQIWLPLIFFLLISNRSLKFEYSSLVLPAVFLLQIIIPLIGPVIAYKKGKVKNLDLPNRKDRIGFLLISSLSWLLSSFLVTFTVITIFLKTIK